MQVLRLPANTAGRDYVIGDLHGCTNTLKIALTAVGFDTKVDRLFSVGDLIDRGPDSLGAIGLLGESWFYAVRGNHEQMMIEGLRDTKAFPYIAWMRNGGIWAYQKTAEELAPYAERLASLPLAIVVGEGDARFNVLHAEFHGSNDELDAGNFSHHQADMMQWGRRVFTEVDEDRPNWEALQAGLSLTMVGHTMVHGPMRVASHVYLDTGCGAGGPLTIMRVGLTGSEMFSVPCVDNLTGIKPS